MVVRKKIFSTALFAPVQYFAHLYNAGEADIEHNCNYSRQSYRNRFVIYGANGSLPLSVPVVKKSGEKTITRDVRVSYDTPWNEVHWKSIESAYNSSPYYLYYKDDIEPIFKKRWNFLIDMNMAALTVAMECTGVDTSVKFTESYIDIYSEAEDYRNTIHPKIDFLTDPLFTPHPYRQVFLGVGGFVPNLSILDLIFNKGPESLLVLRDSLKQ